MIALNQIWEMAKEFTGLSDLNIAIVIIFTLVFFMVYRMLRLGITGK